MIEEQKEIEPEAEEYHDSEQEVLAKEQPEQPADDTEEEGQEGEPEQEHEAGSEQLDQPSAAVSER